MLHYSAPISGLTMSASKFKTPTQNEHSKKRRREMNTSFKKLMKLKDEKELKMVLANALKIYPGTVKYDNIVRVWRDAQ